MAVDMTWSSLTAAQGAGGLALVTGDTLTQTSWQKAMSNIYRLGGSDGNLGVNVGSRFNVALAASVGSNILTVSLKGMDGSDPSSTNPVRIPFRSATAATGTPVVGEATAAVSTTLSSGSTLGFGASEAGSIHVFALYVSGAIELALTRCPGAFPETRLVSTTAEGGAGAADSPTVLYSTTARSSVPCAYLGRIDVTTGATPGQWGSTPTQLSVASPFVFGPNAMRLLVVDNVEASATSSSLTNLKTYSSLNIPVTSSVLIQFLVRKSAVAESVSVRIGVNGSPAMAARGIFTTNAATGQGIAQVWIGPQTTSYLGGLIGFFVSHDGTSETGLVSSSGNVALPNATITSILIDAQNSGGTATYAVTGVRIYEILGA